MYSPYQVIVSFFVATTPVDEEDAGYKQGKIVEYWIPKPNYHPTNDEVRERFPTEKYGSSVGAIPTVICYN